MPVIMEKPGDVYPDGLHTVKKNAQIIQPAAICGLSENRRPAADRLRLGVLSPRATEDRQPLSRSG